MSRPPVIFQRTYVTLAAADLRKVYVRDTIIVDDTGAGIGDVPLQLPKIGTAFAPVGKRVTIVKPSNATHAVAITPAALDAVTANAAAAFPDFGAAGVANTAALPSGAPGAVTIEATDMALTGSVQPNPLGGTPTTAGAWLAVVPSSGGGGGGGGQPLNQVVYGTGAGESSSSALTFDPSFANILTLQDTAAQTVFEAGGLATVARFFNVKDENGQDVLAIDACVAAGPPKRQVTINIENDGSLATFHTLVADRFIRFGDGTGTFMLFDIANQSVSVHASGPHDAVWSVDWGNGHPLTFATIAAATASNGGTHGNGQTAFIDSVLKPTEVSPNGTGVRCWWSAAGPGGPGWYTGSGVIAAE